MFYRSLCLIALAFCLLCSGCKQSHPGNWGQAEIEAYMLKTENPKMTEVKLTPSADGYTATGKAPDGETFQLNIKQNPSLKQLSWDAKGDRGTHILDGKYEFTQ